MGIRDEQKKETYFKIYRAIIELTKEKSYDTITIREVCQRAGISIGSYYKHFQSKDDIIFQQIMNSSSHTREEIAPLLNKGSGLDNLEAYLELQNELLNGNDVPWLREIFRIYLYHRIEPVLDKNSINYVVILKVIKEGQEDGSIRSDMKADELAWIVLKMIIANYYCYCMQDGDFDMKQVMNQEILAICRNICGK